MLKNQYSTIIFLFLIGCFSVNSQKLPEGFVHIDEVIPDVIYDIRYAGNHNFIGKPIAGYEKPQAILSEPAAKALAKVQKELIQKDYMLKVFDAYRPQRAVDEFVEWARDESDTLMKHEFYPDVAKRNLFELGYIASKSGHSRGSTVDLTIVHVENCKEVDMGGPYDFFGEISHHASQKISPEQKKNREILRLAMRKYGFRSYSEEWWHYTYDAEPYSDSYFNFPVR